MTSSDVEVHKGLDGVVVDTTAISMVNEATNSLTYRGYPVQELAADCSFEEVAYLLWDGELPGPDQLNSFLARERKFRELQPEILDYISTSPLSAHPMDVLRTAVSQIGVLDSSASDRSAEASLSKSVDLLAKIATIVAGLQRRRQGLSLIEPSPDLTFAENFLAMCFGEVPDRELVRSFEISLILYMEHSFNASTFTARVVTSTLSDIYSAVTAAIGALKGPLHGGANEAVMQMMLEIEEPERATKWLEKALAEKKLIMGFGHRVYKHGDSRVPTMKAELEKVAALKGGEKWMSIYNDLELMMLREKRMHPNLDFPSGPTYYMMGFDIEMFTPIFVVSRIVGWTAHVIEQAASNSLIRPLSLYVGPSQREVSVSRRV